MNILLGGTGNKYYDPQLGLKRILLAICLQDIRNGLGKGLSNIDKPEDRDARRLESIYYILQDDFEADMEAVGWRHLVKDARIMVVNRATQIPQGCEEIAAKYRRDKFEIPAELEMALELEPA